MTTNVRKLIVSLATIFAVGLAVSWIAGQCSGFRGRGVPRVSPAKVDPGKPTPGPVNESTTVIKSVQIANPELSRDEVMALAVKYGLVLAGKRTGLATERPAPAPETASDAPPIALGVDRPADRLSGPRFPMFLAEETFRHEASGASADVVAVFPAQGERLDLRAVWHEWTPPAPAQCGNDRSYFGNEAKWQKFVGVGGVATGAGAGPGAFGGFGYRGWRVGAVTMGADVLGGATSAGDGFVAGGLTVSW